MKNTYEEFRKKLQEAKIRRGKRLTPEQILIEKNKYNIPIFDNYQNFKENARRYGNYTNKEILREWRRYKHRDLLIATGQYQEIRSEEYRVNYVRAMAEKGIDQNLIEFILNLSLEEWNNFSILPTTDKGSRLKHQAPDLSQFYIEDTDDIGDLNEEIFRTLEQALGSDDPRIQALKEQLQAEGIME